MAVVFVRTLFILSILSLLLSWMRVGNGDQEVVGSTPAGSEHSFMMNHEIFSMVILSLRLIQDGQLSVSGERMCTILVNRLED